MIFDSGRLSMRCPSNHTSPLSGLRSPTMCLRSTLLPVPLGPMTTVQRSASMLNETSLRTTSRPKRLHTLRSSMRDIGGLGKHASHTVQGRVDVLQEFGEEEVE